MPSGISFQSELTNWVSFLSLIFCSKVSAKDVSCPSATLSAAGLFVFSRAFWVVEVVVVLKVLKFIIGLTIIGEAELSMEIC